MAFFAKLLGVGFAPQDTDRAVKDLSLGQRAKLALLMGMQNSNVLVLDEPTRSLAPATNRDVREVLARFPGAIVAVSHDRKFIEEVGTIVFRLDQTGLVEQRRSSASEQLPSEPEQLTVETLWRQILNEGGLCPEVRAAIERKVDKLAERGNLK